MRMQDVQSGAARSDLRAVIMTADKFEDMELFVPYFRLLDEGVAVDIAAPSLEEIGGEHGYSIVPDLLIDDVNPDDYATCCSYPGGSPTGRRPSSVGSRMRKRWRAPSSPPRNRLPRSVTDPGCWCLRTWCEDAR